jgi:hypothetical protein
MRQLYTSSMSISQSVSFADARKNVSNANERNLGSITVDNKKYEVKLTNVGDGGKIIPGQTKIVIDGKTIPLEHDAGENVNGYTFKYGDDVFLVGADNNSKQWHVGKIGDSSGEELFNSVSGKDKFLEGTSAKQNAAETHDVAAQTKYDDFLKLQEQFYPNAIKVITVEPPPVVPEQEPAIAETGTSDSQVKENQSEQEAPAAEPGQGSEIPLETDESATVIGEETSEPKAETPAAAEDAAPPAEPEAISVLGVNQAAVTAEEISPVVPEQEPAIAEPANDGVEAGGVQAEAQIFESSSSEPLLAGDFDKFGVTLKNGYLYFPNGTTHNGEDFSRVKLTDNVTEIKITDLGDGKFSVYTKDDTPETADDILTFQAPTITDETGGIKLSEETEMPVLTAISSEQSTLGAPQFDGDFAQQPVTQQTTSLAGTLTRQEALERVKTIFSEYDRKNGTSISNKLNISLSQGANGEWSVAITPDPAKANTGLAITRRGKEDNRQRDMINTYNHISDVLISHKLSFGYKNTPDSILNARINIGDIDGVSRERFTYYIEFNKTNFNFRGNVGTAFENFARATNKFPIPVEEFMRKDTVYAKSLFSNDLRWVNFVDTHVEEWQKGTKSVDEWVELFHADLLQNHQAVQNHEIVTSNNFRVTIELRNGVWDVVVKGHDNEVIINDHMMNDNARLDRTLINLQNQERADTGQKAVSEYFRAKGYPLATCLVSVSSNQSIVRIGTLSGNRGGEKDQEWARGLFRELGAREIFNPETNTVILELDLDKLLNA